MPREGMGQDRTGELSYLLALVLTVHKAKPEDPRRRLLRSSCVVCPLQGLTAGPGPSTVRPFRRVSVFGRQKRLFDVFPAFCIFLFGFFYLSLPQMLAPGGV